MTKYVHIESQHFVTRLLQNSLYTKAVFEVRTDGAEETRYLEICRYPGLNRALDLM